MDWFARPWGSQRQSNHHWPLQARWPLHQDADKLQFNTKSSSKSVLTQTHKKKKSSKALRFSCFHLGPTGFFREEKEYSQNTPSSLAHPLKPMFTQTLSQSLEGIKNLSKFLTWSTKLNKHKEVCLHENIGLSLPTLILFAQSTMATQKSAVSFHLFAPLTSEVMAQGSQYCHRRRKMFPPLSSALWDAHFHGCVFKTGVGRDSPLWADNSPQEQDSSGSRERSSCGFVHLQTVQLLSLYLLFSFKWHSTYTFRRQLHAVILSPQ